MQWGVSCLKGEGELRPLQLTSAKLPIFGKSLLRFTVPPPNAISHEGYPDVRRFRVVLLEQFWSRGFNDAFAVFLQPEL